MEVLFAASRTQHFGYLLRCAVTTLANQVLESIVNQPQEVGASRTGVCHDVDRPGTDASCRAHVNRDDVSPRSGRPSRFECGPHDLELVPDSFNAVAMLVLSPLGFHSSTRVSLFRGKAGCYWLQTSIALLSISGLRRIVKSS